MLRRCVAPTTPQEYEPLAQDAEAHRERPEARSGASAPEILAWRILRRTVAYCFLVAFLSLAYDMEALAGDDGLWPAVDDGLRLRTDFDLRKRLLYFPSVLHVIGFSYLQLMAVALGGAAASAAAILRPTPARYALAWLLYQSFTVVGGLVLWFPWDGALLEAGMLCALCPALADPPPPEVCTAFP